MKKKEKETITYESPNMKVFEAQVRNLICASNPTMGEDEEGGWR